MNGQRWEDWMLAATGACMAVSYWLLSNEGAESSPANLDAVTIGDPFAATVVAILIWGLVIAVFPRF